MTINVDLIIKNILYIKSHVDKKLIFVVKGGVYGLGYDLISYVDKFVDYYAVSSVSEYLLIEDYTEKQVLVLSPVLSDKIVESRQVIYSISSYDQLLTYRKNGVKNINCALKINTGLNRYGFAYKDDLKDALLLIQNDLNSSVVSVYSHLAASTSEECGVQESVKQHARFMQSIMNNSLNDIGVVDFHYTDSASLMIDVDLTGMTAIRSGMAVLGLNPIYQQSVSFPYEFPISISCYPLHKVNVKKGQFYGYEKRALENISILTIGVGYCDGMRKLWVGKDVVEWEHGKLKVLDVSMNTSIIQVPDDLMDSIELFKTKLSIVDSQEKLNYLAKIAHTSIEDILCGFNSVNVENIYLRDGCVR